MLAEWIKILGLDGEDPPWEGEPREIRAEVQTELLDKIVTILDVSNMENTVYVYAKISSAVVIGEDQGNSIWLNGDQLRNIIIVY